MKGGGVSIPEKESEGAGTVPHAPPMAPASSGHRNTNAEALSERDWVAIGQEAIMRIPVAVRIVLGATRMPVSKLMSLTRGSIIPLDRKVGDLVDIVVNDRIVARGEIVILDEAADRFAVAIREVARPDDE